MANKTYSVYSLADPFDFKIKYVGVTSDIAKRKRTHHASKGYSYPNEFLKQWLITLNQSGNVVKFTVHKTFCDKKSAYAFESLLIKKMQPEFNITGK